MTIFKSSASWVQAGWTVSLPQRPKNPSYATACVHKRTKTWLNTEAAQHLTVKCRAYPAGSHDVSMYTCAPSDGDHLASFRTSSWRPN